MTPTKLFRWSGIALTGAGLLIALGFLLHPDISQPHAAEQAGWVPAHVVLIVSLLLTLFGMIGLFLRQIERIGWLGLGGFVLILTGVVLTTVAITADAFIFPPIEASAAGAALTDPAGPLLNGPLGLMLVGATITFALGAIILGIATLRAGVFSRWPALLLIVGGPLLAADPLLPQIVVLLGAGLTSASLVWFGLTLLGRPARSISAERAALIH
jgi:hypothetical protein